VKTSKKIPKTFIVFLIVSFFIWLLITFSKEYTTVISMPVAYKNIPQNKLFQEKPQKELELSVKASGFKILATQLRKKTISLNIASVTKNKKGNFYLVTKKQSLKIEKQLFSGVSLLDIEQDTIFFNIGELASKKVPVVPNVDINYHIGYDLLGDITLNPDSVTISGPALKLSKINKLELNPLKLADVKANFNETISIAKPENFTGIKLNKTKVAISGKVDKFTEGTVNVPFTIKNLPEDVNLTFLNENVKVVFIVALSNFGKVSASSFAIECDYEISNENNLSYLIPQVTSKPTFVKSMKLIPSKIDFLIQK
jgi:hypothetical protein